MVKVRCQDCGEVSDVKKSEIEDTECDCGGEWAILGSDDDTYGPVKCSICKKDIEGESAYVCGECREEEICEDCIIEFEYAETYYCKNCVNKAYPRPTETKVEYKEKIVEKPVKVYVDKEGTPIDTTYNPSQKSRFD